MSSSDIVYMFAMSVDGFIARPDGAIDWLDGYPPDADFDFDAFMSSITGIVMGRNTYDVVRRHDVWPYSKYPCVVATSRPLDGPPVGVEAMAGGPQALLDNLQRRGANGRIWLLGGGDIARQFLAAGLLDTVEIGTIPVILGNGIPAFAALGADVWLNLNFAEPLANGATHSKYTVSKSRPAV
jgi:dihydrofolate reductase